MLAIEAGIQKTSGIGTMLATGAAGAALGDWSTYATGGDRLKSALLGGGLGALLGAGLNPKVLKQLAAAKVAKV